jgi:tripartite-type tricarboxylate transporter receptor subunit TctC
LCSSLAVAQGVASGRPVRVLVPAPPGGPSDTAIRLILPRLSEGLKQPLVVDNRGGANGVAGTDIASKANPDGHTLAVGNSGTHAINAGLYRKLPYDPVRDFTPIVQMVTSGMVVVANPKVPAGSLTEFINTAKKQPGKFNVGIAGATGELSGDALWAQVQIRMNNVRYKGRAPTELAILGGEVDVALLTPLAVRQHIRQQDQGVHHQRSARRLPRCRPSGAGFTAITRSGWHLRRGAPESDPRREQGGRTGPHRPGGQGALRHARLCRHRQHAAGIRRGGEERGREIPQGDQGIRHRTPVTAERSPRDEG